MGASEQLSTCPTRVVLANMINSSKTYNDMQNQANLYSYILREISGLTELTLGHLR